ncbi:phage portal protein [Levyella massiliensis]|uniref:phage portal protein n=1 Tax=Levyella massiliensis TaxID=938289 RepID=UPI003EB72577
MYYDKAFYMDAEEEMTGEKIQEVIKQHKVIVTRYQALKNLYVGEHSILAQDPKPTTKPDNRLVANFARYIVDTFNGYFMGIPVKTVSDNQIVSDYIQMVERYNDVDDLNADLSKKCDIYGHAFELLYLDEEAQVGITQIAPDECILVRSTSIREEPLYGIRYTTNADGETVGTISDSQSIKYFVIKAGEVQIVDEKENFFHAVPIIEYVENEERVGAFEWVEYLINAYNKALSEKANDVDYFADAYMKILGAKLDEKVLAQIRDYRIINLEKTSGDGQLVVDFMQKPNADTTQENLLERIEKLIFHLSMVPNINDEKFGTASGIALQYKLQSMSNLANTKERKFVKGFNRRYDLISQLPNSKIRPDDLVGIEYKFTRNIPANVRDEAETARSLQGIVSDETILENLSIVGDVKKELERREDEEQLTPMIEMHNHGAVMEDEEATD